MHFRLARQSSTISSLKSELLAASRTIDGLQLQLRVVTSQLAEKNALIDKLTSRITVKQEIIADQYMEQQRQMHQHQPPHERDDEHKQSDATSVLDSIRASFERKMADVQSAADAAMSSLREEMSAQLSAERQRVSELVVRLASTSEELQSTESLMADTLARVLVKKEVNDGLHSRIEELEERVTCKLCCNDSVEHQPKRCMPCTHIALCQRCFDQANWPNQLKTCPQCNQHVQYVQETHISHTQQQ